MKLEYLRTSKPGLRWMREYYRCHPQLDTRRAAVSLRTAERVLSGHPAARRRFEDFETVREYLIQGTSFSLLYTVARDTVWIIDIRDQRGRRGRKRFDGFFAMSARRKTAPAEHAGQAGDASSPAGRGPAQFRLTGGEAAFILHKKEYMESVP